MVGINLEMLFTLSHVYLSWQFRIKILLGNNFKSFKNPSLDALSI